MGLERTYQETIERWQDGLEAAVRADDGWLTVVGLYWLHEGENTVGSAPDNKVQLPPSAPAHFGVIDYRDGVGTLRTNEPGEWDGMTLAEDIAQGGPTVVRLGTVNFFLISRDGEKAVRVRDTESEARRSFGGRAWFPVDPAYRVTATYTAHPTEISLEVETSIGGVIHVQNPGYIEFALAGQSIKLQAFEGGPGKLWLVFRDATSGVSTYGAGRFIYVPFVDEHTVDLDFNKTYHPPCAFTHFATCPLPPPENIMKFPIPAGERYPEG
jgi:uncharacterized protein